MARACRHMDPRTEKMITSKPKRKIALILLCFFSMCTLSAQFAGLRPVKEPFWAVGGGGTLSAFSMDRDGFPLSLTLQGMGATERFLGQGGIQFKADKFAFTGNAKSLWNVGETKSLGVQGFLNGAFIYSTADSLEAGLMASFDYTTAGKNWFRFSANIGFAMVDTVILYKDGNRTRRTDPDISWAVLCEIALAGSPADRLVLWASFSTYEPFVCNYGIPVNLVAGGSFDVTENLAVYGRIKLDSPVMLTNFGRHKSVDFELGASYFLPAGGEK